MIGGERPKLSNRITDYKRKKKGDSSMKRLVLIAGALALWSVLLSSCYFATKIKYLKEQAIKEIDSKDKQEKIQRLENELERLKKEVE